MYNAYISNLSETLKNNESLPFDEKVLSDYVNSKIPLLQPNFTIGYIHDDQVLRLLSSLNVNKSSGTDNLGPRILKLCAPIFYKVVAYLLNLSIKTSIFPDQLKEAKITPIYKKVISRIHAIIAKFQFSRHSPKYLKSIWHQKLRTM